MGSPLRVLHVVVNMNRGGAETLIMNLYKNIDRSKVQFDFLTCKEGLFDEEIQQMGGTIHRIPYITDIGHFKYVEELNRFFNEHNYYKIVHSHMDKMSGLILNAAKKTGIPIRISHSHNTSSEGSFPVRFYKWVIGCNVLGNSTNLFACSREAADWLFQKKSDNAKILKNGIEYKKFSFSPEVRNEVRKELNLNNHFIMGHVGRFNQQKNHSFLIDIFTEVNKRNKESMLLLIGDGPLRGEIEKKVIALGLQENVIFLGIRNDINHILQAFDVFVFPSFHEGLPVSIVEAQGAGLPCVISNVISEEVDLGLNLICFESIKNTPEAWARKVLEQRKIRSANPSKKIQEKGFDISITAVWLEKYYLELVGNKQVKLGSNEELKECQNYHVL
ncbi:glycosyltransferase family 1 protein [Bacillus sp. 1P10SD]|uniref:glycosyltransferase family 1 protein n=1 Tax=Bacillus sp. 1P10SD TaxID=3132265 RepID=UPI0039A7073B